MASDYKDSRNRRISSPATWLLRAVKEAIAGEFPVCYELARGESPNREAQNMDEFIEAASKLVKEDEDVLTGYRAKFEGEAWVASHEPKKDTAADTGS
jgi:2,4-dienoyl-CoA reductase-like NADH-dependent reductase (Old Yellow Enzyme family)